MGILTLLTLKCFKLINEQSYSRVNAEHRAVQDLGNKTAEDLYWHNYEAKCNLNQRGKDSMEVITSEHGYFKRLIHERFGLLDYNNPRSLVTEIELEREDFHNRISEQRNLSSFLIRNGIPLKEKHNTLLGWANHFDSSNARCTDRLIEEAKTKIELDKEIEQRSRSLVDDYADPSTEMMDFMGCDD